jgi:V8-like Glu-specific endopeptidase
MRRTARRAPPARKPARLALVLATAGAVCGTLMLVLADGGASGLARRDILAASQAPTASHTGQAFGGVAAVGALFTETAGKLASHFCTGSVVDSAHGDLVITAAHCVTDKPGQIVFVPGYANGKEPLGVWRVTGVYTDKAWQSRQDQDNDVAFLRLARASDGVPIENVTGAERLGGIAGQQAPSLVQVIGYPDGAAQPVLCVNWIKTFSATQLEFDCGGYTNGTSGGPFLADVSAGSGQGTVIGVIGGYEQGGDTPDVSYSPVFGTAVTELYQAAEAGG